jgi:hypothetical protein
MNRWIGASAPDQPDHHDAADLQARRLRHPHQIDGTSRTWSPSTVRCRVRRARRARGLYYMPSRSGTGHPAPDLRKGG